MIALVVGTETFSFHRLVRAFDELAAAGLPGPAWAQIGSSSHRPEHLPFAELVPFEELSERLRAARVVVAHAGAGTALLCLGLGHRPVLVPRLAREGEHVDDHQVGFARMLAEAGLARCVLDVGELGAALDAAWREAAARPDREGEPAAPTGALGAALDALFAAWEAEGPRP